jgi:hypothetical protein
MEKYRESGEKRMTKKVHPDRLAQIALQEAEFAAHTRNSFFDSAYGDILVDFFIEWLKTEPHESKSREHLYACSMALGSVKQKLISIETKGRNIPIMESLGEENSND